MYKFNNIALFNPKGYPRNTSGCFSVNNFKFLWQMNISYGFIDSLVIKNCPKLERVFAYRNQLTFVDIENCPSLEDLYLEENPLETLDLTGCPNLKEFRIRYTPSEDILLRELIVLESQPWQEWDLDSLRLYVMKKITFIKIINNETDNYNSRCSLYAFFVRCSNKKSNSRLRHRVGFDAIA